MNKISIAGALVSSILFLFLIWGPTSKTVQAATQKTAQTTKQPATQNTTQTVTQDDALPEEPCH